MQYVPFGKTDLCVSEISLGALQINGKPGFKGAEEGDEPEAIRAVQTAVVECGVNFIDTARGYHHSQERIAKALAGIEEGPNVMLATKVSATTEPEKVKEQVEFCLKTLGRESVELMQIHSGTDQEKRDATLSVLQELRDKGLFRFIGVTMGYGASVPEQAMMCIESGAYDAIQLHVNALHPVFTRAILPAAVQAGVATMAMNPQCGGYLSKRCPDASLYDLAFLSELDVRDLYQAALKWCVSVDCIDVAIPGSRRPEHILANCAVSDGQYMDLEQIRIFEDMLGGSIDTSDDWGWLPEDK